MYEIVMTDKAVRALQTIPKADVDKFMQKLAVIARNPYAPLSFVTRLKDSQNFRFRFGDYRGVYTVENAILTIIIIDVAHRKNIYKR